MTLPPTRWELAGPANRGYGETFAQRVAEGADVDGEARLLDAMAPRRARILDIGSGMGRVAAALQARGHHVVATEPDPALRAQSLATTANRHRCSTPTTTAANNRRRQIALRVTEPMGASRPR